MKSHFKAFDFCLRDGWASLSLDRPLLFQNCLLSNKVSNATSNRAVVVHPKPSVSAHVD